MLWHKKYAKRWVHGARRIDLFLLRIFWNQFERSAFLSLYFASACLTLLFFLFPIIRRLFVHHPALLAVCGLLFGIVEVLVLNSYRDEPDAPGPHRHIIFIVLGVVVGVLGFRTLLINRHEEVSFHESISEVFSLIDRREFESALKRLEVARHFHFVDVRYPQFESLYTELKLATNNKEQMYLLRKMGNREWEEFKDKRIRQNSSVSSVSVLAEEQNTRLKSLIPVAEEARRDAVRAFLRNRESDSATWGRQIADTGDPPGPRYFWSSAIAPVEDYIREHVNDPDSLIFEVWGATYLDIFQNQFYWVTPVNFRFRNQFGGYERVRKRAYIQHSRVAFMVNSEGEL